jgi:hypothetical protein
MVEPYPNHGGLGRCHSPLTVTLGVYGAGRKMVAARWLLDGPDASEADGWAEGRLGLDAKLPAAALAALRNDLHPFVLARATEAGRSLRTSKCYRRSGLSSHSWSSRPPGKDRSRELTGRDRARSRSTLRRLVCSTHPDRCSESALQRDGPLQHALFIPPGSVSSVCRSWPHRTPTVRPVSHRRRGVGALLGRRGTRTDRSDLQPLSRPVPHRR